VGAGALAVQEMPHRFVQQVAIDLYAKHFVGQLELANRLTAQI
jgi:hypothetical protein